MISTKNILILIVVLGIVGAFVFVNPFSSYFDALNSQPGYSTVLIVNGVSGVVTLTDPSINKTVDLDVDYLPLGTGSGVIVTPNGYVITAFHVVSDPITLESQKILRKMDDNDLKNYVTKAAVASYLSKYNPQLSESLINNTGTTQGTSKLKQDVNTVTDSLVKKNLISVKSAQQVIKVKFPSSFKVNRENSLNAKLVDVGNSQTDQDMALLKVDPLHNTLPSLSISSKKPTTGETIQIYGFPGGSGVQNNSYSLVTPSTTKGSLINQLATPDGTTYLESNAPVAQGYSGGPVLDTRNSVMGIVVYGVQTRNFTQQMQSQASIFLPSNYLIKICQENNVPIKLSK